jgi:tRNA modification GTPase
VDTAGIRETEEIVEQEGIRRSKRALQSADLVMLVLDSTRGMQQEDQAVITEAPEQKTVVIWNKVDLPSAHEKPCGAIEVSAKEGMGIQMLKEAIESRIWKRGIPSKEEVVITNVRHHEALRAAIHYVEAVVEGLKEGISPEFLSADMRSALKELGMIIGQDISEEILSAIFSKFCVGK